MTRGDFWEAVFTFCLALGGSTTSGIRSEKHNAAVGGVPHSAHRFGLAADVVYDALVDHQRAVDFAASLGLWLLRESDHDHVQPSSWLPG